MAQNHELDPDDPNYSSGWPSDGETGHDAAQGDDVESRAADLMARMAAQRQRRDEPSPESSAEGLSPFTGAHSSADPEIAGTDTSADALDESLSHRDDLPVQPAGPGGDRPPLEHDSAEFEFTHDELPPEPSFDAESGQGGRHRTPRRMAQPPWQPGPRASRADLYSSGRYDMSDEQTPPQPPYPSEEDVDPVADAPPSADPPPQPAPWPVDPPASGPPPPPPNWAGPPPPPNWPGPPPWMPPPPRWQPPPRPPHRSGESAPAFPPPSRRRQRSSEDSRPAADPSPPTGGPARRAYLPPPSLDESEILGRDEPTPQFGWRRALHQVTGGRVNPGRSQKDREQQELLDVIRQPLVGDFRIAVLSIKGGVGKTTTTIGLGSAFAMVRADRVIAIDANPDRGTLGERVPDTSTTSTVRDLLRDPRIKRYADVRNHTRMAPSRLEVLASEQDPAVSEVFGETDYRRTINILQDFYNVILTDCGTGIMHSAMNAVLDMAHAIVLVSTPAIDAARSAAATLDWLAQHGYGALARDSHVVLSGAQHNTSSDQLEKVSAYFESRCGSIHVIPFEPHLATGADVDFGLLSPGTVRAYLEIAGAVAQKFSRLR